MKAKSKKWAAESLVKETESKTPLTPKQQREAGELTAEMLLSLIPVGKLLPVGKLKKLFKGKAKGGYIKKYANGGSVRKVRR